MTRTDQIAANLSDREHAIMHDFDALKGVECNA
jgi:hypothetical protein